MKFAAIVFLLIVGIANISAQNNTVWGDVANTRLLLTQRVDVPKGWLRVRKSQVTYRSVSNNFVLMSLSQRWLSSVWSSIDRTNSCTRHSSYGLWGSPRDRFHFWRWTWTDFRHNSHRIEKKSWNHFCCQFLWLNKLRIENWEKHFPAFHLTIHRIDELRCVRNLNEIECTSRNRNSQKSVSYCTRRSFVCVRVLKRMRV